VHLETATARVTNRVSAEVATATTVVDNASNKAVIETTEGAANKEVIETTEVTEVAVDVLPTVVNEVVGPSTTTIGPVPVATT
tara:strand:- start:237 stop:485 length:249 start_codon:yes stop_codon:yes gene_type:complete